MESSADLTEEVGKRNNESGEDAGGLDASISSSAAASCEEDAACFYENPDHTSCVRENLPDPGLDTGGICPMKLE
ncbi:hypothetical protein T484DRAFT_1922603 [Baffinella frigidus]|nr:hypothetical protein T484DRAFT_1922603 [Cryptophyta sp. CCMP2293]